jgi:DNA modification methylase
MAKNAAPRAADSCRAVTGGVNGGRSMRRATSEALWADVDSGPSVVTPDGRGRILIGDCLTVLRSMPASSIDTVLTSPPYWQTRDYGVAGQLGLEPEPAQYVAKLAEIFGEVRRVLKPRGTAWLNVGDVFLRGAKYSENSERRHSQPWVRNKQLALLPFRTAIALQEAGWIVRNVGVWAKPNAMPASVTDRLTNTWEPVFLLAKDEEYFFDLDRIRVQPKTSDEGPEAKPGRGKASGRTDLRQWLNSPRHRMHIDGLKQIDRRPYAPDAWVLAAYLKEQAKLRGMHVKQIAKRLGLPYERTRHYFRPDKIGSRLPPPEVWAKIKALLDLDDRYDAPMAVQIGDNAIRNHPKGKNPGDVFQVSVEPFDAEHFAVMPMTLAHRLLLATLPKGGVVLDPFAGCGTTGVAALELGGRFVGIELASKYAKVALARMVRAGLNEHQRPRRA